MLELEQAAATDASTANPTNVLRIGIPFVAERSRERSTWPAIAEGYLRGSQENRRAAMISPATPQAATIATSFHAKVNGVP